ncbi:MAG: transglycosylase family protein [Patescibacteria group bacterium]|nr:transglycosylase family protein [Patescibacteria group bacterium]
MERLRSLFGDLLSGLSETLSPRVRNFIVLSGCVFFAGLLALQLAGHDQSRSVQAYGTEPTGTAMILGMFRRVPQYRSPLPSGNPTPLPTFTPTPTPTATPTPIPTRTPTPSPTLTPSPTPVPTVYIPPPAPAEIDEFFRKYAAEYGVEESQLRKIAACESGYNPTSHNTAHDYAGMFQFSRATWESTRAQMGADQNADLRFNAEEAIRTAAFKISRGGIGGWPSCK